MTETKPAGERQKFEIFRRKDGRPYDQTGPMYMATISEATAEGWPKLVDAGYMRGNDLKLLYSAPGMSLTYVWFKSGIPLPRHSHNADCLYYIIAGSLRIGTEELGAGEGFFVGIDVPYAYVPGEQGVEVLEFRTSNHFEMRFLADNPAFWTKAAEQIRGRVSAWATEEKPSAAISQGL
jgi:hypothetical protein